MILVFSIILQLQYGINAFIIGSSDAHNSEYIREFDMRRAWISQFTGSAGSAVVTQTEAKLWTDGRYWLQAEEQLSPDWSIMKDRLKCTPSISEWLCETLKTGDKVGVDPWLISAKDASKYKEELNGISNYLEFIPSILY